jgi:hypothetical protein
MKTITLYRPLGPKELVLIEQSGWKAFPPRLPDQPIFYPVMNEEYAIQIARDWNVPASGSGFVTRFAVDADYLSSFTEQVVGGAMHRELWVPAEELEEFNQHIIGLIEVTHSFPTSPKGAAQQSPGQVCAADAALGDDRPPLPLDEP